MDSPARAVAAKLGELKRFGDHALAGERGVAMDQHRQDGEAGIADVQHVLLGPDHALQNRVYGLEMTRVRDQADRDSPAVRRGVPALGAQVVLDVA